MRLLPAARARPRTGLPARRPASAGGLAGPHDHLREVTRDDVLAHLAQLERHERYLAVSARRSLFTWAKKISTAGGCAWAAPTGRWES
jgi:hypothetical protein